jgi:hypothetical protein
LCIGPIYRLPSFPRHHHRTADKIGAPGATRGKADNLAIMAMKVVEVRECDRCGKEPAHTWVITGPEGATREIELCDRHASAVANAFALGRAVTTHATRGRPRRGAAARTQATPVTSANGSAKPEPEPIWR